MVMTEADRRRARAEDALLRSEERFRTLFDAVPVGLYRTTSDGRIANANPAKVRHVPFQNQSRMPVVYRTGDLFVLPSIREETWGLAVNEALASGRPVLISDRVGCAPDVVIDGENGWVFPAGDWDAFLVHAKAAAFDRERLKAMRAAAFESSIAFDIPATADTLVAAVDSVLKGAKPTLK